MAKPLTYYCKLSAEAEAELKSMPPQAKLDLARGLIDTAQDWLAKMSDFRRIRPKNTI
jgi:inorganic triphosphatase YgiF